MKLAIMQPYFFPYIGYFSLMHYADQFILFDTPQYHRKGWMHRNRILKGGGSWKYINVQVQKPPFKASVKEVLLKEDVGFGDLRNQLEVYRQKAAFFDDTITLLEKIEAESKTCTSLVELNLLCLRRVQEYIGIDCKTTVFSEMDLGIEESLQAGEWAPTIAKAMGASVYVNPPGGREIFDPTVFQEVGIELCFLDHALKPYPQLGDEFEPGLSVIDLLMFLSKDQVREYLADYTLS